MCAGSMSPAERTVSWKTKRVFFLTPQVLTNDLTCGQCPAADIKCVVVDEAHKALGNHSYCQVSIKTHYTHTWSVQKEIELSL
jgi:Fanconi anemia group M protein